MPDMTALVALLQTARYAQDVTDGHNGRVLALLREEDPTAAVRKRPITLDNFMSALRNETSPEIQNRLLVLSNLGGLVPVHDLGFDAWMQANLSNGARTRIARLSEAPGRYCDVVLAPDEDDVSLQYVREAVRQIPSALANRQSQIEAANQARYAARDAQAATIQPTVEAEYDADPDAAIAPEILDPMRDRLARINADRVAEGLPPLDDSLYREEAIRRETVLRVLKAEGVR